MYCSPAIANTPVTQCRTASLIRRVYRLRIVASFTREAEPNDFGVPVKPCQLQEPLRCVGGRLDMLARR